MNILDLKYPANRIIAPAATGVASQDTAMLQALINQSGATRKTIELMPNQNYQITELVPVSGARITGYGSKLSATASSTQGIISNRTLQVPVDGFDISGVEFVGEGQTVGTASERRGAIHIYNGKNIRIRDCVAHDFSDHGFSIRNAQQVWMQDNVLYNVCDWFLGNALDISLGIAGNTPNPEATTRAIVTGNVVRNCRTAPVCIQATAHQSEFTGPIYDYDIIIADNPYLEAMVEDVASHGFSAIALEIARYGSAGQTSQGNYISKVHVHHNNCYVRGISGTNSPTTNGISVSDNNGSNGPQSADWNEFCDITIDHNIIDSVDNGIGCQASRVTIDHNVIRADKRGIVVAFNNAAGHLPEQILVDGNIVHMNAASAVGAGIYALTTAHTTIQGNRIAYYGTASSASSDGIYGNGVSNLRIVDNNVRGSTRHGINLFSVTGHSIENNKIINPSSGATNTGHGCYLNTVTGDTNSKGVLRNNELSDDRGASSMMAQALSVQGGAPRLIASGNLMLGATGFPVNIATTQVYWWGMNNFGQATGPWLPATITPSASPYTYTLSAAGNSPYLQEVIVRGGTVSKIEKKRGGATAVDTGMIAGMFRLELNDSLIVTYSVAPTMQSNPVGPG